MQSQSTSQNDFLFSIDKVILKFKWRGKGLTIAKIILQKKNKIGEFILIDFKTYYKVKVRYYGISENTKTDQWN